MKLFVRGLPGNWKDDDLRKRFENYGAIWARVFMDRETGASKRCGNLDIPDDKKARIAMDRENGASATGTGRDKLSVQPDKFQKQGDQHSGGQIPKHAQPAALQDEVRFPYRFALRDAGKRFGPEPKGELKQLPFHHRLDPSRYDVAFEVEWVTKTPVAANPCSDPKEEHKCFPVPEGDKNEYTGYDKRWLRVDGKLAISPFTVKSAIANGFANLLGGCIRVPTKIEKHADLGEGKYPYNGAYKRYRVGGGQSKPGILMNDPKDVAAAKDFDIERVKEEFYCDDDPLPYNSLPFKVGQGTKVVALIEPRPDPRDRKKPWKVVKIESPANSGKLKPVGNQKKREIFYHGAYFWGMDPYAGGAKSKFNRTKTHRHRFYTLHDPTETTKGTIPAWQFGDKRDLENLMFMGRDQINKKNPDRNHRWFQKIDNLKKGDWVYFEEFNGRVAAIGKSFLFKAAFHHQDTVPDGQRECKDMRKLCPRCAMFGMTDETKRKDRPAVGYRGRFKASALVCDEILEPIAELKEGVPVITDKTSKTVQAPIKAWGHGKSDIKCRQFLLPIQGQPKPNKPDEDAYFDPTSGFVKGIKTCRHGKITNLKDMEKSIEKTDSKLTLADHLPNAFEREKKRLEGLPYGHSLRSWAEVCDSGMVFKGTLGAENSSPEEIAAVVLLLDTGIAGHGFKIGTGKALELGSVESHIKKIWIRDSERYVKPEKDNSWITIDVINPQALTESLKDRLPKVKDELDELQKVSEFERRINQLDKNELPLACPPPGFHHWDYAQQTGLNSMP